MKETGRAEVELKMPRPQTGHFIALARVCCVVVFETYLKQIQVVYGINIEGFPLKALLFMLRFADQFQFSALIETLTVAIAERVTCPLHTLLLSE